MALRRQLRPVHGAGKYIWCELRVSTTGLGFPRRCPPSRPHADESKLFDFQNRKVANDRRKADLVSSTAHRLQQPRRRLFVALTIALASVLVSPIAAAADEWIGTWAASPQPVWDADFPIPTGFPRTLWI